MKISKYQNFTKNMHSKRSVSNRKAFVSNHETTQFLIIEALNGTNLYHR